MDKPTWDKIKKDLNAMPVREKLLYLKEILKTVKEKELAIEIDSELKRAQEIIDNEESPKEAQPLKVQETEPQKRNRETLEGELLSTKPQEPAGNRYGIVQELEKNGRNPDSLYEQKPYESSNRLYESPAKVEMMEESERRLEEHSSTRSDSTLEQGSISKKDRMMYLR